MNDERQSSECSSDTVQAWTNYGTIEEQGSEEGISAVEGCGIREGNRAVEGCEIGEENRAVEGCGIGGGNRAAERCGTREENCVVEGCGIGEKHAVEGCSIGGGNRAVEENHAVERYGIEEENRAIEDMGEENRAVERCGIRDRNRAVEGCGIGSGDEIADCVVDDSENSNGDENDTDFLVLQATARIPESEVSLELRLRDISEDQKVEQFMTTGCSCTKWKGNSCSFQFTSEHVKDMRLSCMELTHSELDLIIMGQVLACTNTGEHTVTDVHHIAHHDRKHQYTNFLHQGHQICIETFRFLHVVGAKRLKNIVKSIKMNGIAPRIHGNIKRMPLNTLTLKEVQDVIYFLLNYCEKHALLLPGRVPGYSRTDIKLLPSSTSKRRIWNIYKETAEQAETHVIAYSTFCRLWKTQLPYIVLMKPMTDLCWKCQQNGNSILRAANSSDSIKSARIEEALEHLRIVQVERSHYRTICKECEREIKAFFTNNNTFTPPSLHAHIPSNSVPIKAHYSFDYAQQVHFPSDPMQPGPIYFLTPQGFF